MSSALSEGRARARKLENEIDSKLVQLSRLDATGGTSQLQQEIEAALQQLTDVNDRLSHDASSSGPGSTATTMHMLQRHREILHDFQQDFAKSKASLRAAAERSELLSSVREEIREHRSAEMRASEALLRERGAIHASERAADDIIGQAQATRDALKVQRGGTLVAHTCSRGACTLCVAFPHD